MNVILSLFSLAICSFLGIYKSFRLSKRTVCLEQINLMFEQMRTYIQCDNMKTKDIISNLSKSKQLNTLYFLPKCTDLLQQGESFIISWEKSIEDSKNLLPLEQRDFRLLIMISHSIGVVDAIAQISSINNAIQMCNEQKAISLKDYQEKSKLYSCMGVLTGMAMFLLII